MQIWYTHMLTHNLNCKHVYNCKDSYEHTYIQILVWAQVLHNHMHNSKKPLYQCIGCILQLEYNNV